jgi:hypothetical protein
LDEGKVIYRKPVVPRRDPTTLFDPIEEPLDSVARAVQIRACRCDLLLSQLTWVIQQWSLATLREIMSQSFKVGDLVRKRAGYEYPGIIVSVFTTRAGAVRYVVEADHPGFAGMLHIFNGEQLEPRA